MFDRTMYIMRGLPGSGKSKFAKDIVRSFAAAFWYTDPELICSTDNYWIRPDGAYDFNPARLGHAHAWNVAQVRKLADDWNCPGIVVDNTNIQLAHMQPYLDIAQEFGFTPVFLIPDTPWAWDVDECAARNTHGVPRDAIQRMKDRFEPHPGMVWPIPT